MGTRSLVVFQDEQEQDICVVYRQFDGSPKSRGQQLLDFVRERPLVFGIGDYNAKEANGIDDLAAQWIAWEKTTQTEGEHNIGNVYMMPCNTREVDEEYIYFVKEDMENVRFVVTCFDVYNRVYLSREGMDKWQTRT